MASRALSPAPSVTLTPLSLKAMKSPTFGFSPMSGYGNTLEQPPDFALDGGAIAEERAPRKFFGGGSPSWIFHGWIFALSATGVRQGELQKLIERHGGEVSRIVHKRVNLLVATEKAVARNTQSVRKAKAKDIPMVTPAFIHDSLRHGEVLEADIETYEPGKPPPPPKPRAPWASVDHFRWVRAIRRLLRASAGGTLRRRLLRAQVLSKHLDHLKDQADHLQWWTEHPAEHRALFRRRLRKARNKGRLVTEGKLVRLC